MAAKTPSNLLSFLKTALTTYKYETYYPYVAALILLVELCLGCLIIENVAYTEIDWQAYMQQIGSFLDGQYDYMELKGQTGPLVYPAGFVYIYSFFYWLTDQGRNIVRGT